MSIADFMLAQAQSWRVLADELDRAAFDGRHDGPAMRAISAQAAAYRRAAKRIDIEAGAAQPFTIPVAGERDLRTGKIMGQGNSASIGLDPDPPAGGISIGPAFTGGIAARPADLSAQPGTLDLDPDLAARIEADQ